MPPKSSRKAAKKAGKAAKSITREKMDVSWLQKASPESRVRLLFFINNGDPFEFCKKYRNEFEKDVIAAQTATKRSLENNEIEYIDNALKDRVTTILSSEIQSVPHGIPCSEHEITKEEIDLIVLHSACKYLKIENPNEDKVKFDKIYQKLNFSEKEIKTHLALDIDKLQYIDVAQALDDVTVWKIWEETSNQAKRETKKRNLPFDTDILGSGSTVTTSNIQHCKEIFDSVISISKPNCNALKEALFFLVVMQLQLELKINRVYTGKLVEIFKKCHVNNTIIDKFRCYPHSVNSLTPSGFCIIFSVLKDRKGAKTEIKKVSETFQNLGFIIYEKEDPSLEDIENMSAELNKPKYMFYTSLVCWFISHGNNQVVNLKDGDSDRGKLIQKFTNLKNFIKKPKIIFMASCLGNKDLTLQEREGYRVTTDFRIPEQICMDIPDYMKDITAVHREMDRLVAYSTLDDHYAYRSVEEGSVYVDRVCNLLNQDENRGRNITEVLEETAQELHQLLFLNEDSTSQGFVKQGSRYESTLQKTFKVPHQTKISDP